MSLDRTDFDMLENQLQCTAEFVAKALKQLFFILFITPENMSCIHIKQ